MKLTKAEKAWVVKVNKVLAECPSDRLGFATIGDSELFIFDATGMDDIYRVLERGNTDFLPAAASLGLVADEAIHFPNNVESTAG
jgi:hypothetical protein